MGYRTFKQAMQERFGTKVYKLSLDGGMTCPNRDGTLGRRGCIFCSDCGSGDFAEPMCEEIGLQMERAKSRVRQKNKNGKYIAYFQSFTNTYAPLPYLEKLYWSAAMPEDIVALSIATRPDCLPQEVLSLLSEINRVKPVWVELGLQSINPKSAAFIRRGYELACFDDAAKRLKEAGLELIVHMILGLPGETKEQMLQTADYIGKSGADGIKLQLLHVLEGTDLQAEYEKGRLRLPSLEEYIAWIEACLRILPPDLVIHRLTGDGPKKSLIAPLWSADKKRVLQTMYETFERDDLQQGSLWDPSESGQDKAIRRNV